jgi:ABC-2 type transport system permease protein
LLIFGYVVTTDVRDIRVALLDYSKTKESRMLFDALDANKTFRVTHLADHPKDLDRLILDRKVDLVITVGAAFAGKIRKGQSAAVQILVDGSMSNMASVRIAYTTTVLERLNNRLIRELYGERMDYGKVDPRMRTWFNPNLESRDFFVPAIVAVLIMITTLLFTSMAIIREKEAGTIEQLIVTPLRPVELILGKTIPYIIIAQGQMIVVTVFAVLWFNIPMKGSALLLFLGACMFLLSTLGIGLFISTISATQQQAMMTTFFFLLPFFMFSGFVFPISNMPVLIQWLSYLNPLRYFLVIIRGIFLKGVGLEVLWPQFAALAVLGSIVFSGAVLRFKKRLD